MTPDMKLSRRQVMNVLEGSFGPRLSASRYHDSNETTSVDLAVFENPRGSPWVVCSTLSLHQTPNLLEGRDIRVELLIRGHSDETAIANAVASAAFFVKKDGWLAAPGVVFPDQLSEYFPDVGARHLMWAEPSFAPELLTVELDCGVRVQWLQAIPIHESERVFLMKEGYDALDEALAGAETFNLWREPVR